MGTCSAARDAQDELLTEDDKIFLKNHTFPYNETHGDDIVFYLETLLFSYRYPGGVGHFRNQGPTNTIANTRVARGLAAFKKALAPSTLALVA